MSKNLAIEKLCQKYDIDSSDKFKHAQGWTIIKRTGIDKIQARENINISYELVEFTQGKSCALKATANWNDQYRESYGEVNESNCKNSYVLSTAQARATSRLVLKLTGFYELGVHSEDDDRTFKEDLQEDQNKEVTNKPKLSRDRFIEAMKKIEKNPKDIMDHLNNFYLEEDLQKEYDRIKKKLKLK